MRSYESGDELADEIEKRARLFITEFTDVPADCWGVLVEGVDRTPRQMIAYQLGWMELLLGWERDERSGSAVVTPAPGFTWGRLGKLYESFYARWEDAPPTKLAEAFDQGVDAVCAWVRSLSEDELFGEEQRAWAASTPSAWPVWKWIHINTVAPFTTFRTKIRKWKRLADAG
ncbi:ClbS/DfsB family four-helix bundle protein [Thermophilibacter immobilis]|uniref:ClbS/DfsB family four-helix bundle protein n=1 Tax=Thermophilibacter immobilis TaxID=2779519 RepID=A0A7S7M850_9ACTN|nr:ClbS/DfsB family four-helix bundle protein [Thermophilibacter immobilis]QOY60520.1 ClbS/DfsB family four-helix bundle protein [Thermophilibacter immobilis]